MWEEVRDGGGLVEEECQTRRGRAEGSSTRPVCVRPVTGASGSGGRLKKEVVRVAVRGAGVGEGGNLTESLLVLICHN